MSRQRRTRTARDRLRDADRDVRYAAAKELRDAARISADDVRALVAALDDQDYGVEAVPDHAGGYQDDPFAIAEVAAEALRRHRAGHRPLIEQLAAGRV